MFFQDWYGLVRIVIAGGMGYAALVGLLRVSGKRTLAKMNAFDLVITVALGSSFGTLLLSRQVRILEGIAVFGLLIGLQYLVAWSAARSEHVHNLVKAEPSLLFYRGEYLRAALLRERVTDDEVRAAVRAQGLASMDEVEAVILETAGDLSVVMQAGRARSSALVDIVADADWGSASGDMSRAVSSVGKAVRATRTPLRMKRIWRIVCIGVRSCWHRKS